MGLGGKGSVREEHRLCASVGEARVLFRWQGRELRTCRVDRRTGSGNGGGGVADRRGGLARISGAGFVAGAAEVAGLRRGALRPTWVARDYRFQPPVPAVRQSKTAAGAAAGGRPE